jgi:hypothetical protein
LSSQTTDLVPSRRESSINAPSAGDRLGARAPTLALPGARARS